MRSRTVCSAVLILALAALAGCFHAATIPHLGGRGAPGAGPSFHWTLNIAALICIVLAIASVVAHTWIPLSPVGTGGLVGCAVGAWVLDYLLINFWWAFCLLFVAAGALVVYQVWAGTRNHVKGKTGWLVSWLESRANIDFDGDGTVGAPAPVPPQPPAAVTA